MKTQHGKKQINICFKKKAKRVINFKKRKTQPRMELRTAQQGQLTLVGLSALGDPKHHSIITPTVTHTLYRWGNRHREA